MEKELSCREFAEALFNAIRDDPELLRGTAVTPTMRIHEAAALSVLLDWAEGRVAGFTHLPQEVRNLVAGFITEILAGLVLESRAPQQKRAWRVPAGLSGTEQAKHAVAQELRAMKGRPPRTH